MSDIYSVLLNEKVNEGFYAALRCDLERTAKLIDASPSGLRMTVWSEIFKLLDIKGKIQCEAPFVPIVQRWAYCAYDYLAAELLFLAFRRCDAEKRAEVYIKLLHPGKQHLLQMELATPARLPPSNLRPSMAVIAPELPNATPFQTIPTGPSRQARPAPGALPSALPKHQPLPQRQLFAFSPPVNEVPAGVRTLGPPSPTAVAIRKELSTTRTSAAQAPLVAPARKEKRLLSWDDESVQLLAATMTRKLSPPRKRSALEARSIQPLQPLAPRPHPALTYAPPVGPTRPTWRVATETAERMRLQQQNTEVSYHIAQLQRMLPPQFRCPPLPPEPATDDLALLRRRNSDLQGIHARLQMEFQKDQASHQQQFSSPEMVGAAREQAHGPLPGPPALSQPTLLERAAPIGPPAAVRPGGAHTVLQQFTPMPAPQGGPRPPQLPPAKPSPVSPPATAASTQKFELPVLTTTEMRRLLRRWAPLLDEMSPRERELIWRLCRTVPNFTTRKYASVKDALQEWSQPNCPQALQSSVGVLFSAVALLQVSGELSAKLLLPDSNVLAFQEGKERLRFKSYFASLLSSRQRRTNFIESLKDEIDACNTNQASVVDGAK